MFGFVEVPARDVRKMLEARDREQIVPIGRLPDVDEARQRGAMIPEIAGADFETTHGAMVRVARNAQGALPPNLLQDVVRRLIGRDVALDVEGNDVRVLLAPKLVLRDLRAWHDEELVFATGSLGFAGDVFEVGSELIFGDAEAAAAERSGAGGAGQG